MQNRHERAKNYQRLSSLDTNSTLLMPSKPQEARKDRFTYVRNRSVSFAANDPTIQSFTSDLQHSSSQFINPHRRLIPTSLNDTSNSKQDRQSPIDTLENLHTSTHSEFHHARRNSKQGTNKVLSHKSLNEIEFTLNSDDDNEGSAAHPKTIVIQKPVMSSTVLQKFKPMISILPKSLDIPESLKNEWYEDYKIKRYNLYWYPSKSNDQDRRPTGREGASLTIVGSKAYVYGGRSIGILRELHIHDLSRNRWKIPAVTGDVPRQGRAGHSAVAIKSTIWIFGGETEAPANTMSRVCLNSIITFNTVLNQWNSIQARCLRDPILPRRNHAACVYDQVMVVYGGIAQSGDYMNDLWVFNTDSKIWKLIDVKESRSDDQGIAYHTICSVFQGKEAFLNENQRRKVAMEGFYVFGGRSQKGDVLGRLKLLRYDRGGMSWTYPKTTGVVPAARYGHSMVYNPEGGNLIIYGGRNDKLFQAQKSCCLNDLNVLNLTNLSWCAVSTFGDHYTESRYAHAACLYQNQMVIFGGLHDYSFVDSEIRRLELDQEEVKRLQARDIKNANLRRVTLGSQFKNLVEKIIDEQDFEADLMKKSKTKPRTISFIEPEEKSKHSFH